MVDTIDLTNRKSGQSHRTDTDLPEYFEEIWERLSAGIAAFGFLFLPVLTGTWANTHMGTEILGLEHPLKMYFLGACLGGVLFFFVSTPSSKR